MNKIKCFILIVLSAALVGAAVEARAQGLDNVLVSAAGKTFRQSEMDQLIQFYEWTFRASFTPAEKAYFQRLTVNEFRARPAESRKTIDDVAVTLPKILAASEDLQEATRKNLLEVLLPDLEKDASESSKILLAVYRRGAGGETREEPETPTAETTTNDTPSPSTGGAGAQKLVGAWFRSDGTGGARDYTGKTRYNSGTDTTFEFFADGRMLVTVKKETLSITQCRIDETTKLPGTYTVSGSQLTMNLATGTTVGTDSCQASGNFKKTLTASKLVQTFVVKNLDSVFRPDAPLVLCLDGAADDQCFERLVK
ncbi:MAG: hypothetical protein JSS81_22610 [Acidobacteria bacterium]|nr:hypothetical protein [Acidobacteriota bacterium]